MGMFSEITTENNIKSFVEKINQEISIAKNDETIEILKKLRDWALDQFEWTTPSWAKKYKE